MPLPSAMTYNGGAMDMTGLNDALEKAGPPRKGSRVGRWLRRTVYGALAVTVVWQAAYALQVRGLIPRYVTKAHIHSLLPAGIVVWQGILAYRWVFPRARLFPRFSLRTLAVFILFSTCAWALWLHWEPWYLEHRLEHHEGDVSDAAFSPDGAVMMTTGTDKTAAILDVRTGRVRHVL